LRQAPQADIAQPASTSAAMTVSVTFGTCGVLGLILLGFLAGTRYADALALVACIALVISTVSIGFDLLFRRGERTGTAAAIRPAARTTLRTAGSDRPLQRILLHHGGLIAVAVVTAATVQTWFFGASSVAGGDLSPPNGTAWIGHLFSPWVWSGSNLGGPGTLQQEAPWAAVLGLVHVLGGSEGAAERIWCTIAFVGAGMACYSLLRVSGLRMAGSTFGALCYCFNPFVMTSVGPNPLYLVTLAMIPSVALIVVAAGRGRLRVRWGALLIAASAPMLGYTFLNPPLTAMVAATIVLSPVAVFFVWGRGDGRRALRTVAVGVPLLALLSCYWIVPALLSLGGAATGQLGATSSWTWTEIRSGLANAIWLNTTWAWGYPKYFAFAARYATFPLTVIRYLIPAAAFAALPLGSMVAAPREVRRTTVFAGASALFFVILATGTLWPGKVIFDPLYQLPLGWLLREPGRLLLFAGLAYAVLVGITVDIACDVLARQNGLLRGHRFTSRLLSPTSVRLALGTALAAVVFVTNEPFALGSMIVPPGRTNTVTTTHVTVPRYWTSMAEFINRSEDKGNVVVLPPDDYYQMPYSWGYYGADGFIQDMFDRNVLDPSGQGYWPGQQEVIAAVNLIANAALAQNWYLLDQLLAAVGTPDILLRGDINSSYPGRDIVSPAALQVALAHDPYLVVAHSDGPLVLYARRGGVPPLAGYTTVDNASPDLADLAVLPADTALVSGPMRPGIPALIEVNPSQWKIDGGVATVVVLERSGWTYAARSIGDSVTGFAALGESRQSSPLVTSEARGPTSNSLQISFPVASNQLPNGNFAQGLWEPQVGDCNAANPAQARAEMHASVLRNEGPDGLNVLRLEAGLDTACESQKLAWTSGPVILRIQTRNVAGTGPRLCLYAIGPNECIPLPPVPATPAWSTYGATAVPPVGTTGLALFLYSDGPGGGAKSVNEYSNGAIYNLAFSPVVLATPTPTPTPTPFQARRGRLVTSDSSYSSTWAGPIGGTHVLVDGMKNGWLVPPGVPVSPTPHYRNAWMVVSAAAVSAAAMVVLLVSVGFILLMEYRRQKQNDPETPV
jgi:hypothetical protein